MYVLCLLHALITSPITIPECSSHSWDTNGLHETPEVEDDVIRDRGTVAQSSWKMEDLQKYFETHQEKKDFVGHSSKVKEREDLWVPGI